MWGRAAPMRTQSLRIKKGFMSISMFIFMSCARLI